MALVVAGGRGWSWFFVNKPPRGPVEPSPPLACTSSVASPALDTVGIGVGGAAIATGIAVAMNGDVWREHWGPIVTGVPVAIAGVIVTPMFITSAVEGYS